MRTVQLAAMIDWYTNVLGLRSGNRPDFSFSGAWMYAGESTIVHLVCVEGLAGTGAEVELKLEHFALTATGCATFEAQLQALGEHYQRAELSQLNLIQINLWDPDGNHIHIDFPVKE